MEKTTYVDFNTGTGLESYREKSLKNLAVFRTVFDFSLFKAAKITFQNTDENQLLLYKIAEYAQLSVEDVQGMNYSDELLNLSLDQRSNFGCTAIGKNGIIGQNLDLFTLDLAVVRDDNALYLTMPPYLALFGMNHKLAFCINYLPYFVTSGTPISSIRRNILQQHSLSEAMEYLSKVQSATAANFLLSDGSRIANVELLPSGARIQNALAAKNNTYFAHTNHILQQDIRKDQSCPRLSQAVNRLEADSELETILLERGVFVPITQQSPLGFGSIITVILDLKQGIFSYRDFFSNNFEEIQL